MKEENLKSLERLSKTAYRSGILPIFLGVLVIFVDTINGDIPHILVGLFIFITGYSYVKIASKISRIIDDENA